MVLDIGNSLQGLVNSIAKFFPVFREILSSFPYPVLEFFGWIIWLLLSFAIAKIIVSFIG